MSEKCFITNLIQKQRAYFNSGKTKALDFRIKQLKSLKRSININETLILDSLKKDLNKTSFEGYTTEIGFVINEIDFMIKKLKSFAKPVKVKTSLFYIGGSSFIIPEPLGVVLVIGPWNYPFQLIISPLVGAMAAGNCAVVKPSELSPNVSTVIDKIIKDTFEEEYIACVEGGVETATALLEHRFDHIFFTGGIRIGKTVMEAAAKYVTPVTLELGGKSPCIVDKDINTEHSARRIVWGKFLNAGQTCVAPDYLLVQKEVKDELVDKIRRAIAEFYGKDPIKSDHYARIINEKHFDRLVRLLREGRILTGGDINREERYIAPTVIDNVSCDSETMQEEIFGPILPVMEYENLEEAIEFVNNRPKPLALYFFSKDRIKQNMVISRTISGGISINDTISHIANKHLPFGGVGESGMGSYHGRASFGTFSHMKSVFINTFLFDAKIKYPPYKMSLKEIKRLMRFL